MTDFTFSFRHPSETAILGPAGPGLALLVLLSAGCTVYQPKTLDSAAVDAALRPPELAAVRIATAALSHPLLRPAVIDGHNGFTPDEVALLVVIANPKLRALRDQRGLARAQIIQAGLLPNPQLGYTFDQQRGNSDPTLVNGHSLGLSWEATALLGYRDRVAAAKSTENALELDIAWQEWQAAQAARLTAYRVLSLQARLPLIRENEASLADALVLAREAHARHLMTTVDLAAATESWSAAQDARFALEQELVAQRVSLASAVGLPADSPPVLKAVVEVPAPILSPTADAKTLLNGLEKHRLDLVALTLGYDSAEASLRAAVKAQFPKISLSFGKSRDTTDVRTRNFGVTIDLPLFDRNQGQIANATATRQQLFDEYVARVAEARAEVIQILANLEIVGAQLRTVEAGLPEIEQLSSALDRAMQTRNADAQAARDARAALLARRAEQASLRQNLLELGVALELATGRPLLSQAARN